MSKDYNVNLNGKETVSKAAKEASGGLGELTENVNKAVEAAKGFIAFEAIKKIAEYASECADEFGRWERSQIQLKTALGGNNDSLEKMNSLIETTAKKSLASKDEIEHLVAEVASLGKSDTDIQRLVTAATNLSNVTGKDLNSSFQLLNATYTGTAGKLDKLIPQIGDMSKAQLEAGGAIDLVNQKFGGITDNMAGGYSQAVSNYKKSWDEVKQQLGENAALIFQPAVEWLTKLNEKLAEFIKQTRELGQKKDTTPPETKLANDEADLARAQRTLAAAQEKLDYYSKMKANTPESKADKYEYVSAFAQAVDDAKSAITELTKSIAQDKKEIAAKQPRDLGSDGIEKPSKSVVTPTAIDYTSLYPMFSGYYQTISQDLSDTIDYAQRIADVQSQDSANNAEYWDSIEQQSANAVDYTQRIASVQANDSAKRVSEAAAQLQALQAIRSLAEKQVVSSGIANLGSSGQAGGLIQDAYQNISQFGLKLGIIVTLIETVLKPVIATLAPQLDTALKPILQLISWAGTVIGTYIGEELQQFAPVIKTIAIIVKDLIKPALDMMGGSMAGLQPVFDLLTGLLKSFGTILLVIMAPLQWLGDLITWVGNEIKYGITNFLNWLASINIAGQHPFGALATTAVNPGAFTSDAFTGLQKRIADLWAGTDNELDKTSTSSLGGSTTTGSSASYAQAPIYNNTFTINTDVMVGNGCYDDFVKGVLTRGKQLGLTS